MHVPSQINGSIILFFLNQQFITQGARADRGSYFVTTYIQTGTTWKRKDKGKI